MNTWWLCSLVGYIIFRPFCIKPKKKMLMNQLVYFWAMGVILTQEIMLHKSKMSKIWRRHDQHSGEILGLREDDLSSCLGPTMSSCDLGKSRQVTLPPWVPSFFIGMMLKVVKLKVCPWVCFLWERMIGCHQQLICMSLWKLKVWFGKRRATETILKWANKCSTCWVFFWITVLGMSWFCLPLSVLHTPWSFRCKSYSTKQLPSWNRVRRME